MLSAAIIAKNEEKNIRRCLESAARVCDELVVIDTGSTDTTIDECYAADIGDATLVIGHFEWCDDFAAARNVALERCTNPWALTLGADDILPEDTVAAIRSQLPALNETSYQVVTLQLVMCDDDGDELLSFQREKLVRTEMRWVGAVHECMPHRYGTSRPWKVLTGRSRATAGRNRRILEAQHEAGERGQRHLFYLARERFWARDFAGCVPLYRLWMRGDGVPVHELYSAHLDLASAEEQLGHRDLARIERQIAAVICPTRAEAWAALAQMSERDGDWDVAAVLWQNAVDAVRPTEGFCVEAMYGEFPRQQLKRVRGAINA